MASGYSRSDPTLAFNLTRIKEDPTALVKDGSYSHSSIKTISNEPYATISRTQRIRYSRVPAEFLEPTTQSPNFDQQNSEHQYNAISDDKRPGFNGNKSRGSWQQEIKKAQVDNGRNFSAWRKKYRGKRCGCWRAFSKYFSDSLYMIPLHIMFLGVSSSIVYIGIKYIGECPMNEDIPYIFLSMGILGIIANCFHIAFVVYKYIAPSKKCNELLYSIYVVNYFFFVMLTLEFGFFFAKTPSFQQKDGNFCNPFFYTFIYWINWSVLLIIFVLILIHGPSFIGT